MNINIELAHKYGINASILYEFFCSKFEKNKWFYIPQKEIEKETTLSKYQQSQALKKLDDLIKTKISGLPARKFYLIIK